MAEFDPEKNNNQNESEKDLVMFENKIGLADDMKRLGMSNFFCDVKFLVGKSREPIYGVKAILASRSRIFCKILYEKHIKEQSFKHQTKVDKKLRYFLKRYSEPILQASELDTSGHSRANDVFLIEEFEPDEFQPIIEYIHCGSVMLQPRTLLGIMNAADYYGLEELKKVCMGFVKQCVNLDTVCTLLASADRFFHYKSTRYLLQKVFEFVDERGYEVLNLGAFTILPQHVVRLILSRKGLKADELTKFHVRKIVKKVKSLYSFKSEMMINILTMKLVHRIKVFNLVLRAYSRPSFSFLQKMIRFIDILPQENFSTMQMLNPRHDTIILYRTEGSSLLVITILTVKTQN